MIISRDTLRILAAQDDNLATSALNFWLDVRHRFPVVKALPTKDTSFVFHSCDGVLLVVISTDAGYLR